MIKTIEQMKKEYETVFDEFIPLRNEEEDGEDTIFRYFW